MVTKGYQKGVYERVTKGIKGEDSQVTPLVRMRYGALVRYRVTCPLRSCRKPKLQDSWTRGEQVYDLDQDRTDVGSR